MDKEEKMAFVYFCIKKKKNWGLIEYGESLFALKPLFGRISYPKKAKW